MNYELILQQTIFPDLLRGRKDFDLPHTKAVVHWIKKIVDTAPHLDKKVLITAAYAHDWGYIDMGIEGKLKDVMKAKPLHMQIGSDRIYCFLTEKLADQYTSKQIERIRHLVLIHDKLKDIKDEDEVALVEADTLGSLDTDLVTPTFSKEDNDKYIQQVMKHRRPLFAHAIAIQRFNELLQKRIDFYL